MEKGAKISECGKYRYELWRVWDNSKSRVTFIMLNPSIANENIDDPTIRRCIGFAKYWGYGGIHVCNLFAYRSTDPKELLKVEDPIGPLNKSHITSCSYLSDIVIFAWGNGNIVSKLMAKNKEYQPLEDVYSKKANYIELSKDGVPKHPLYLKKDNKPKSYQK